MKKAVYLDQLGLIDYHLQMAKENLLCGYDQNLYENLLNIADLATDLRRLAYEVEAD